MSTAAELDRRLQNGIPLTELELEQWITVSDVSNAGQFYVGADMGMITRTSETIVKQYLNNSDANAVPLRRKTKYCLLLNNFALYAPLRPSVFQALDSLTSIFESSIREEGTMPFDSELGRMSEHVLVLLMRVTDYKLKASAVLEFAENNTQFAIQLLLAILLKEPAYEFALRCNCISALLGFTSPQAFFAPGQAIEEHSCEKFTEKIDFMLNLMLRLEAIQVVSDVLGDAMMSPDETNTMAMTAVNNTMRTIMNVFKFSHQHSTQWRQHVLLSTTFLDSTVILEVQTLGARLQEALRQSPPAVSGDVLQSLNLTFRFGAFATYHLGDDARMLRLFCTFFNDCFLLSIRPIVTNARLSGLFMVMYCNLLHFMCNVDALGGDEGLPSSELLPELTSAALRQTVENFLKVEVAACGLPFTQAWHQQFKRMDSDVQLSKDSTTYQIIDGLFQTIEQQLAAQQQPVPAAATGELRLLGDMPSLKKPKQTDKISIEKAAKPVKQKQKAVKKDVTAGVDADLLCALTGNIMKQPVSSPYGQTFEKEDILNWLEQNGSICPITGKPLTSSQLVPNQAVQQKIMQQMVRATMASQPQGNDDDLYNF